MKRKLLIALLCAAAMYCLAWTGLADRWDGDWLYANSGSTAVIKDYSGSAEAVEVPRQVTDGSSRLTVVGIAENVFKRKTFIRTVILPDSVTSIGNNAFDSCTGLTSVTIPDSVTSIGAYAFNQCTSLTQIEISDGVTSIGDNMFSGCIGLTSVAIPDGVTSIGNDAFRGCTGLTSVAIPGSVTSIRAYAFNQCTSLTQIEISDGVTSIGDNMFSGCTGLTSVTIPDSVTSFGERAFEGCTGLTSVTIPDSVTSIGFGAFMNCAGLRSATIPGSVTSIGAYAFNQCTSLTQIEISDGVTSIGDNMFSGCTGLTSVTIPGSVTSIGAYAFNQCANLTQIKISDGVTSIGDNMFSGCTGLTSVAIPDSVTSIGNYAFSGCTGLTSVAIPDSVTSIGNNAFSGCTGLTSVAIPGSVTSIGKGAFRNCTGLTSVTIPGSVTSIGTYTFFQCANLTDIYYVGEQAQWQAVEKGAFWNEGCSAGLKVHCLFTMFTITTDDAARAYYYNDSFEQVFPTEARERTELSLMVDDSAVPGAGNYFTGEFTVNGRSLGREYSEDGLTSWPVTSFTMPDEAVTVGAVKAAKETLALTFAPGETRALPMDAWMQLQFVEPPLIRYDEATGTEALDVNRDGKPDLQIAFDDAAYCVNLTRLPACAAFGEFAFAFAGPTDRYGTIAFTIPAPAFGTPDFTLPAALTTVEEEAFEGIAASVVDVPEGCASIGDHAFRNCPNLTQIRIPANCELGEDVFEGCAMVYVFGAAGSSAEAYCSTHANCVFVAVSAN